MPTSGHAQFFKIPFHSLPSYNLVATRGNGRKPQPSRHSFKVQVHDCRLKAFRPAICLLVRNPAFKGFRLGLAAAEDKRIQAGFADEARYLLSPVGVTNNDPRFFIVIQFCNRLTAISKS